MSDSATMGDPGNTADVGVGGFAENTDGDGCAEKFYGKYRGTVVNNVDPMQKGRIQALVPDVSPIPLLNWAMACVPFTGKQTGMWVLPQIGTGVWIEFEQGNIEYPIWSGGFWGSPAEPPALASAAPPAVPNIVLQTTAQNTLMLSDLPGQAGGILLKSRTGAFISVSDAGIVISTGTSTIMMGGPSISIVGKPVDINTGALTII